MTPAVFGLKLGNTSMLAPFATLAFLGILWLAAIVVAEMLGHGSGKLIAALKGRSVMATAPLTYANVVRIGQRPQVQQPMRARPRFSDQRRAAA